MRNKHFVTNTNHIALWDAVFIVAQIPELICLMKGAILRNPFLGGGARLAALNGLIDELRVSKVARPDALLLADAVSQGSDSKLTKFGADEQQAGKSHFGFILAAMPLDAWVVVAILGLMMAVSWIIMIDRKSVV